MDNEFYFLLFSIINFAVNIFILTDVHICPLKKKYRLLCKLLFQLFDLWLVIETFYALVSSSVKDDTTICLQSCYKD